MKRICALTLMLFLLFTAALAQEFTDDLSGSVIFPEGATEADAMFVYRYAYPQAAGDDEVAALINETYDLILREELEFKAPILYAQLLGEVPSSVDITYRITCHNEDYLSFLFTSVSRLDGYEQIVRSAHVFALTGSKAGQVCSLPYLLGTLQAGETDTWLLDRQTAKADECIRTMILDMLEDDGMPDGVDEEFLEYFFYPEEDFYMDESGALVFFLQPYLDENILTFRFTIDEILDEM